MTLDEAHIAAYLAHRLGRAVQVLTLQVLAPAASPVSDQRGDLKVYGYGQPVLVHYRVDGVEQRAVLRTMAANPFGHERRADRAAGLLLSYDTFNELPQHVRARDVGVLLPDGQLASLQQGSEFFLLTDYVEGTLYADDLQRLRDTGHLTARDLRRAERLARYLAEIHAVKRADPSGAQRRARNYRCDGQPAVLPCSGPRPARPAFRRGLGALPG